MSEFELRRRLQALKVDREPARDLWAGIASRLEAPARASVAAAAPVRAPARFVPWAFAASVALVALTGTLLWRAPSAPDAALAARDVPPWTLVQAQALDAAYAGAVRSAHGGRAGATLAERLPPDLYAATTELDAAQAQLEAALRANPDATYLLHRLRRAHEQRLRLARLTTQLG
jgi:hypothetical protein